MVVCGQGHAEVVGGVVHSRSGLVRGDERPVEAAIVEKLLGNVVAVVGGFAVYG
jgi:hypothetical protein